MVAKKRMSKRQTLQQKYKIKKRTKEHHRRLNRGKVGGNQLTKKKDKDHIPNDYPFKEELLKEVQVAKEKLEENKARQKEKRREEIMKRRKGIDTESSNSPNSDALAMAKLAQKAAAAATRLEAEKEAGDDDSDDGAMDANEQNMGQQSRRAYLRELRKTVERSDVVLQVLDARDPYGTKSSAVEDMVLTNQRKKLVYVLNKADLIPRDVLVGWLKELRQHHPTVPFKCNTQQQKSNLGMVVGKVTKQQEDNALQGNRTVGAEELLGLLKNYCRVGDNKTIISVGIVGFPNVGKSSLINSLLRTRAVGVSPTPGFTKTSQEVILDKNIRLIDSPGIVFADGNTTATALRNCVNVDEIEDVYTPIQGILEKCPAMYLMQLYSIPHFEQSDFMGFLNLIAKAMGKLKKGGIPNSDAAARTVLHDWNIGKIKYFCRPPVHKVTTTGKRGSSSSANKEVEKDSKILTGYSNELDIEKLADTDMRVLDDLYSSANSNSRSDAEISVGIDTVDMMT